MMTTALASTEVSPWIGLFGSFHPGIVHFPIGLLTAAALLEAWQIVRKKPGLSPATPALIIIAALAAPPASLFGFLLAEYKGTEGSTLNLHKWLGLASALVALLAVAAVIKARTSAGALKLCRAAIFVGTGFVSATGYLGGEMTFGPGHITKPLYNNARYLKIINASPFDDPVCAGCAYVPYCYVKKCAHERQDAYRTRDGQVRYSNPPACRRAAHRAFGDLVRLKRRIAASDDGVDPRFPGKKVTP